MRRIEYVKVLVVVVGLMVAGGGAVWGAAGDVLWEVNLMSSIKKSSPAIDTDGTIYISSVNDYFYAINPDGSIKWQIDGSIDGSPSVGFDGTIYIALHDGIYALNNDATVKWQYFSPSSFGNIVIGVDGTIYAGRAQGEVVALNADGTEKWTYTAGSAMNRTGIAIAEDGTIYFGSEDNLYALNADGTLKWKYETVDAISSSPAIDSTGDIYFGSGHNLYSLNADGTFKWKYFINFLLDTSPVIGKDDIVYFGTHANKLYALNSDGSIHWEFDTGDHLSTPLIGDDDSIYIIEGNGHIYCVDSDGTEKWLINISGELSNSYQSSPTINSNGILFCASDIGIISAIDTGTNAGLADSPWPKFQCNNKNTGRKSEMYFAEIPGGTVDGVTVEPFQMGITEVTNQQYADFLNEALAESWISVQGNRVYGSGELFIDRLLFDFSWVTDTTNKSWITFNGSEFLADDSHKNWPVVGLEWEGALAYASYYGYSIPTQSEYNLAGSAGYGYEYGTNNGTIHENNVNFNNTVGHPVDVGSYPANPYGLYDLSGNISEYIFGYGYMVAGNYTSSADECKSAYHNWEPKETGFRLIDRDVSTFLMFPNGGETFFPGQNIEIIWQGRKDVVDLKYSTDGGSTWQSIESGVNALDMRYIWEVPNELSDNCKVLIEYGNSSTNFDKSNEVFSIVVDTSLKKLLQDIPFIAVPEGSFTMGFNDGNSGEMPEHKVSLNSLYVGQYEVTQKQYIDLMNTNPSRYDSHEDMPVHNVTWYNAVHFCNILSDRAGFDRCYNENTWECDYQKNGFRLPTEAEYEYTCRAGTSTLYYFGEEPTNLTNYVWNQDNSLGTPRITGQKIPNNWMLYDIVGNVNEWCNDWFDEDYYENSPSLNPTGPEEGTDRAFRGHHFAGNTFWSHSANRGRGSPGGAWPNNGFRIVRRESRTIQGKILDDTGSPVQFASIQITGAVTDTTVTTDDTGTYTFAGWLGGDYTVTPSKVGCSFSPASLTVSIGFEDVTDADFIATVDEKYIIEHGITLAVIPAGSFEMGSDDDELHAKPIHSVTLDGFLMSATEVTQGQYESFMGENPSLFTGNMSLPIEYVKWYDAATFCNNLSIKAGLDPCYDLTTWTCDFSKNGYRLPTEAEWEYACRGKTETKYFFGNSENDLAQAGWYNVNSGGNTHIVAQKIANDFGIYDMYKSRFKSAALKRRFKSETP